MFPIRQRVFATSGLTLTALLGTLYCSNTFAIESSPSESVHLTMCDGEYNQLTSCIASQRTKFKTAYESSSTSEDKEKVVELASNFVIDSLIQKVLPAWYGTSYKYGSNSQKPREGHIDCGHFVTTTLHDVGFNLPNPNALAQYASLHIMQTMMKPKSSGLRLRNIAQSYLNLGRTYHQPEWTAQTLDADIRKWGRGVYIIGLDSHIGYIVNDGNNTAFVHASYYPSNILNRRFESIGVVSEPLDSSTAKSLSPLHSYNAKTGRRNPLEDSKIRVVCKLTNKKTIERWIARAVYSR